MSAGVHSAGKKPRNTPTAPYALKELDSTAEIASFFGFLPIKTPEITKDDLLKADQFKHDIEKALDEERVHALPEEKIALLRTYLEHNMVNLPHPLMLYYKKPLGGLGEKKKPNMHQYGLDIIGTGNSVAEALTIKTLYAILADHGFENMCVEINTMGDKDSVVRFERELSFFIKKNIGNSSEVARALLKKDPLDLLRSKDPALAVLKESAPKPMSCLTDASIEHFKEVLEYLETLNIPYRINENLVGDKNYCSQTVFKITGILRSKKGEMSEEMTLAHGCRHNQISKKIGFKKDVPIMSATISFKKAPDTIYKVMTKKVQQPKFYFIQLGFRARLKSLQIIDTLRKAQIPVYHSLTKDKLLNQLTTAENLHLSHLIIMGQKEALEDTVVIRNMETRAQDTINCCELCTYLERLQKAK